MLHSITHRKGAALRDAEEREPIQPCGGGYCGHVAGHRIFRDRLDIPVRQAVSALVEAHEMANVSEPGEKGTPNWTVPFIFKVVHPVGPLQHGCSLANSGPSDLHPVRRCRELHPLMQSRFERPRRLRWRVRRPLPDADRTGDVLHSLVAHIAEGHLDPVGNRLMYNVRDAQAARLGETLEAGGNVYPVAEDVSVLEEHVAKIYTDAIEDPAVFRLAGVALGHRSLDLDSTFDRLNDARELGEQAVAAGLNDIAPMRRDPWPDDLADMRPQARKCTGLVNLHHSAVAGDISRKNRRKLTQIGRAS